MEELNRLARYHFKNRDLDRAEYYLKTILEKEEDHEAYFYLGMILNMKNDSDKALYYFYKSLQIESEYGNASNEIGVLLLRLGKEKESVYWFKKAIKSRHNEALHIPLFNLAMIYKLWNRPERSLQYLHQAIKQKPDFREALNLRDELIS